MTNHPLEQEELMAYLDGELPASRATAASDHLESCAECRDLAADLQSVSRRLMAWQAEPSGPANMEAIDAALEERAKKPLPAVGSRRNWFGNPMGRRLMMSGGLAAAVLALLWIAMPMHGPGGVTYEKSTIWTNEPKPAMPSGTVTAKNGGGGRGRSTQPRVPGNKTVLGLTATPSALADKLPATSTDQKGTAVYAYDQLNKLGGASESPAVSAQKESKDDNHPHNYDGLGRVATANDAHANIRSKAAAPAAIKQAPVTRDPMIIHTAQLELTTREFDKTRTEVESILKLHHGYAGELNVNTPAGAARSLNGTLRVPATELDAMLNDLKRLGRVEHESQGGEEVTERYVDLEARLANARNTERRLTDILRERTGKLADVLAVEESISTTRGEIEQMEAERKNMANQVDYATIQVTITEEYKASLEVVPVTTWTRISNSGVEGYHNLVEGLISLVLVLVSSGPSLLFWGLLLFFPVRMIWKKIRLRVAA